MTSPEDDRIAPPARGDAGLPEVAEQTEPSDDGSVASLRSLRDDVEALIDDGKTYLETEVVYQRTRAAFVAERAKDAVLFGAVAAALAVLALIGLTVGLIIALTPLLSAWGASALVVALLLIAAWLCLRTAASRWARLMAAIETKREP